MKNNGLIILITILTITGLTAFSCVNNAKSETPNNPLEIDTNSISKELSDFGIAGGIKIDYRTGKATQNAPSKPELSYMVVRGSSGSNSLTRTGRPIKEEKIRNAQTIADVIENYPSNWITAYNSVSVVTTINDKTIEAIGPDDKLTNEQKEILKTATNVLLIVQYQKENNKNEIQNRQMNVPLVVTPKTEAKYIGGFDKMISYLKSNSLKEINSKNFTHLPQPSISFIINEDGEAESVKLIDTSRDEEIDQLLIDLIKNMPKWTPAKNKDGVTIKQEFMLNVGQDGC